MDATVKERPRTRKATRVDVLGIVKEGGPLINGTMLRCPGCEKEDDVLSYTPLEFSERYADQIVVPLKCRSCRHVFALKP